jgi:DNA excision repair protein ERCC-5
VQSLLRLFGVPWLTAAGEAEAQCAQLERARLVSGSVCDDSDVWLFGARTVYRHLFNTQRHVHKYTDTRVTMLTGACVRRSLTHDLQV